MATASTLMTTEELLALPDDGVERWLIRGELREKHPPPEGPPMTVRNRFHSRVMMLVRHLLLFHGKGPWIVACGGQLIAGLLEDGQFSLPVLRWIVSMSRA